MVQVGNIYHILVLLLVVLIDVLLYYYLRNKPKEYIHKFLLVWCFAGFALHFLKQFVYWSFYSLRKSTAENICAVSTMIFPFIMLKKKQSSLHDFMFLIGVVGGLAGMVYPTNVIGDPLFTFESFRFFFCHASLLSIPILLVCLDVYRLNLKNFWKMPLYFLVYEVIICANTALVIVTGLYNNSEGLTFIELFLDHNILNNSFVFGPTDDMGAVGQLIGSMCPNFMKTDIFHIYGGNTVYWPVIWLFIPSIILFIPLYFLFASPFYFIKKRKENKNNPVSN